jgi:uncharacterized protein YjdB
VCYTTLKAPLCYLQIQEHLTKQINMSQATSRKLNESVAVNNDLKKQLEVKEEVLNSINEKQEQLQTKIDGLTKTVDSINQVVHSLFEKQEQPQTKIDGLTKRVEILNKTSQLRCGTKEDVSTCKITAVTVSSLKYLRQSATSNLGQTSTFRSNVLPPSSGSHLYNGLAPLVYIYGVLLAIFTV